MNNPNLLTADNLPLRVKMKRTGGKTMDFMRQFPVIEHMGLVEGLFVCLDGKDRVIKKMTAEQFRGGLQLHPDTKAVMVGPDTFRQLEALMPLMQKSLKSGFMQSVNSEKKGFIN